MYNYYYHKFSIYLVSIVSNCILLLILLLLVGNTDAALALAQLCIDGNYCTVSGLILQAIIHLQKGNQKQCNQLLETALSTDFEVFYYYSYIFICIIINRYNIIHCIY